MIAYNKTWLKNLFIRNEAFDALEENVITPEEQLSINNIYPVSFYTPNFFIRTGLFILSIIILVFSFGLLALLCLGIIEKAYGALLIFFSLLTYAGLEWMIRIKNHYRSGVDDALLYCAATTMFFGVILPTDFTGLQYSMLIFIIAVYCTMRFADRLMVAMSYVSFLGLIFFSFTQFNSVAKITLPFILMAFSWAVYFVAKKLNKAEYNMYAGCLAVLEIMSLVGLYAAGNYFVVTGLNKLMLGENGHPLPLGRLFWIFTIIIPLLYIFRGVQKKDMILLRTGMLLVAAIVFTVRYYHTIAPLEILMLVAGIVLVTAAWLLTKYLHIPRYGFTCKLTSSKQSTVKLNMESLIIAETFSQLPGADDTKKFGGGSFGGGGASGDF